MKAMKGTYPFLHDDIIDEILLRVQVKSLLRFKSVCHRWHTIINSRGFMRDHFRLKSNNPGLLVYWKGAVHYSEKKWIWRESVYAISLIQQPDKALERYDGADYMDLPEHIISMRGPCYGIFCVRCNDYPLALWNPAMRTLRPVPLLPFKNHWSYVHCLGVDPLTDDLKIVFIDRSFQDPNFAVYSVGNRTWKLIKDEALVDRDNNMVDNHDGSTFSNGFCYWLKHDRRSNFYVCILVYDICNESFQEIETPNIFKPNVERKLHWYDDSLALSTYQRIGDEGCFDIWLMKEQGCWTKISTVSLPFGTFTGIKVLKRNQLLAVAFNKSVMIHDITSRNTRSVEFRRVDHATLEHLLALPYRESLFSL